MGSLVYGAGIPALAIVLLWRNRRRLNTIEVSEKYRFLYDGYTLAHGKYLWECIVVFRKLSVIVISVTIADAFTQVMVV